MNIVNLFQDEDRYYNSKTENRNEITNYSGERYSST